MKIKYDKKLLVAMGKSRMAKSWQNREILWSELLDKYKGNKGGCIRRHPYGPQRCYVRTEGDSQ